LLREANYRVIVVSNQAGIGRGLMTESDLTQIHDQMKLEAIEAGGQIQAIYYCPHDWDAGCVCRKPKAGMLFQAQRDLHIDLTRARFIGDDERDQEAAEAAGCRFEMVTSQNSLLEITRKVLSDNGKKSIGHWT
jgi:D-glycero-D-manno-heptose 1,7-bisphosphate phosphatase